MINELDLLYGNVILLLLVFLRISIMFSISGIFELFSFNNNIKVFFVFLLSTIIYTQQDTTVLSKGITTDLFVSILIMDVISAIVIGFVIKSVIEIYKMYGETLSYASGLSMSTFYDPSGGIAHVYTPLLKFLMIVAIFTIDGHHIFIMGLVESFNFLPLGTTIDYFNADNFWKIVNAFIYIFALVFFSSLPFMFIAIAIDVYLSFATKSMPAFNVFVIGIQAKILIVMLVFYFSLPFIFELFINVLEELNYLLIF